ncbi:MAG: hypothetical protein L0F84_05390, partial [Lactococcus raffinolactis]|nr:hypothetical protein [Lactococcus raffinolactis]
ALPVLSSSSLIDAQCSHSFAVSLVTEYRCLSKVTVIRQVDPRCIGFGSFIFLGADLVQIAFYSIENVAKGKKIRGILCVFKM